MKNKSEKIVLILNALVFGGYGISYLIDPIKTASQVGISLTDTSAIVDAQGIYGGVELALAFYLLRSIFKNELLTGLQVGAYFVSAIAIARVIAILRYGVPGTSVLTLIGLDIFGAVVTYFFYLRYRRQLGNR